MVTNVVTPQHDGLDGYPGDACGWDGGGAQGDQGCADLDAPLGDAHDGDDAEPQGDAGLQKQMSVRGTPMGNMVRTLSD